MAKKKEEYKKLTPGLILRRNPKRKNLVMGKKVFKTLLRRALGQTAFDKS